MLTVSFAGLFAAAAVLSGAFTFDIAPSGKLPDPDGWGRWPAAPATFAGGVTAQANVIYAQPQHYRPLRLDLYRPASPGPHPLIVHVHGGSWVGGTKRRGGPIRDYPAVLAQLAARGYVVASVEYRLDGEAKWPAAEQDVKAAIRFLRTHAGEYGIDPAHVGIFGESAGGQLAALTAATCGERAFEPASDEPGAAVSDCVQAAAPWFGFYDFATIEPPGATIPPAYLGCETPTCPDDKLRFASPVTYVGPGDPPMLLVHGAADKVVAVAQTQELERKLRAAKVPVETLYVEGAGHMLAATTPQATHDALARALEATADFFDRTLKAR